jgi:hypothetical protein
MQSLSLLGGGHGASSSAPRITVSGAAGFATVLSGSTTTRVSRDVFCESGFLVPSS